MTRTRHDERPESASLVAARQLAEEAHHHRLPDRRGVPARRRPHVPSAPTVRGPGADPTDAGS
ncbi:hypothetical protein [Blastococcus xanthinilyticus]|uniref:Uncharacterized protein n=1 Tax=Blastococcus xanthinilyticus TaxID=1564164 RepID=A0A5S5CR22_9ACTN|nr:hypothetical protein [Blastococcus xanthinilyticus]TYP84639.1 hypothetical protein BD833_11468 [Blastococcus xanthinilyticus]